MQSDDLAVGGWVAIVGDPEGDCCDVILKDCSTADVVEVSVRPDTSICITRRGFGGIAGAASIRPSANSSLEQTTSSSRPCAMPFHLQGVSARCIHHHIHLEALLLVAT
jgi:hypothetical protein